MITTCFTDGTGPDLYPSPGGGYPFTAIDVQTHFHAVAGTYDIRLTVSDDGGSHRARGDGATLQTTTAARHGRAPRARARSSEAVDPIPKRRASCRGSWHSRLACYAGSPDIESEATASLNSTGHTNHYFRRENSALTGCMMKERLAVMGIAVLVAAVIVTIGLLAPTDRFEKTVSYEVRIAMTSEMPYTIIVPALLDSDHMLIGTADRMTMTEPVSLRETGALHGLGLEITGNASTTIRFECNDCYAELSMADDSPYPDSHSYFHVYLSSSTNFTISLGLTFQYDHGRYQMFLYGLMKWGIAGCDHGYSRAQNYYSTANWTEMLGTVTGLCWDGFTFMPILALMIVAPGYAIGLFLLATGLRSERGKWLKCKVCGSLDVVPILYGLPPSGDVMEMELPARDDGKPAYVIGGPTATADGPRWQCSVCGNRFGSLSDPFR